MVTPVIPDMPAAPNRTQGGPAFSATADTFVAALQPLVVAINNGLAWMNSTMSTTEGYKNAAGLSATGAADSAILAGQKVGLAADQVALAITARQGAEAARASSEVIAASVQAAAGTPSLVGNGGKALVAKFDETGVEFKALGQAIGDVLETTRTPDATYVLPDTIYSRAAYPDLFAVVGTQGQNNDASNFASVSHGLGALFNLKSIAAGKDNVFIAVGFNSTTGNNTGRAVRSVDGGITWTPIAALQGKWSFSSISTDGDGVWVVSEIGNGGNSAYRSTDNGVTWSAEFALPGITQATNGTLIATNKTGVWIASAVSYGATNGSISTNNGLTWSEITTLPFNATKLVCTASGAWLISNTSGTYRSEDNGSTWLQVLPVANTLVTGGGVVVATVSGNTNILVSVDDGKVFRPASLQGVGGVLAVDSTGAIFNPAAGRRLYKSFDAGITWALTVQTANVSFALYAIDSIGTWITIGPSADTFYRATRLYNYDVATQFKTPFRKTPKGYTAYIKGKLQ